MTMRGVWGALALVGLLIAGLAGVTGIRVSDCTDRCHWLPELGLPAAGITVLALLASYLCARRASGRRGPGAGPLLAAAAVLYVGWWIAFIVETVSTAS